MEDNRQIIVRDLVGFGKRGDFFRKVHIILDEAAED
jgi:hypothetical protein